MAASIDEVLGKTDVIVVGNASPEFADALRRTRRQQQVIDLVRVKVERAEIPARHEGSCW